jgi:creatinine amidohydrolase
MQWEQLTAPDFETARKETGGVCIMAVGSLEKHFDHLPIGTDFLNGHRLCCLAAEKEPAIVFPPYYFAQNHESKPFPGAISLPPLLNLEVLMATCDEIARNGFTKIVLYNAHGGNWAMLYYFIQIQLAERKDYVVYLLRHLFPPGLRQAAWSEILETDIHAHACECETSITLANFPEMVKMEELKGRKAGPLNRFEHLRPGDVVGDWYADYPDHYAGDATAASREKGLKLLDMQVDALADYIGAVKNDDVVQGVIDEFYDRCEDLGKSE